MRIQATVAAIAAMCLAAAGAAAQTQTTPAAPPPGPADAAPATLLPALIEHSRLTAAYDADGRLTGAGADLLRALGARSQFVVLGESHGNAGIADFAAAYWRDLHDAGYRYGAIEVDPWTAAVLERELRAGGLQAWTRFIDTHGGARAAPFFGWTEEAAFARAIVQSAPTPRTPALWGLDQVFLGAAPWLLDEIAAGARSAEARAIAARLAVESRADFEWLGKVDPAALNALRAELTHRRDTDYAARIDAMLQSRNIYEPFTGGAGEAYLANAERENLMRRYFRENYARAEAADRGPPRVLVKVGGNHANRGASPVMVQGLGGFISEFAAARDTQVLTILALCGPGGHAAEFGPGTSPCAEGYSGDWAFLAPYIDRTQITLFDLRTWRMRPRRWAHLPADVQRTAASFDILVIAPDSPAAAWLPGLPPPPAR